MLYGLFFYKCDLSLPFSKQTVYRQYCQRSKKVPATVPVTEHKRPSENHSGRQGSYKGEDRRDAKYEYGLPETIIALAIKLVEMSELVQRFEGNTDQFVPK